MRFFSLYLDVSHDGLDEKYFSASLYLNRLSDRRYEGPLKCAKNLLANSKQLTGANIRSGSFPKVAVPCGVFNVSNVSRALVLAKSQPPPT
jgi:hypothetical protein